MPGKAVIEHFPSKRLISGNATSFVDG